MAPRRKTNAEKLAEIKAQHPGPPGAAAKKTATARPSQSSKQPPKPRLSQAEKLARIKAMHAGGEPEIVSTVYSLKELRQRKARKIFIASACAAVLFCCMVLLAGKVYMSTRSFVDEMITFSTKVEVSSLIARTSNKATEYSLNLASTAKDLLVSQSESVKATSVKVTQDFLVSQSETLKSAWVKAAGTVQDLVISKSEMLKSAWIKAAGTVQDLVISKSEMLKSAWVKAAGYVRDLLVSQSETLKSAWIKKAEMADFLVSQFEQVRDTLVMQSETLKATWVEVVGHIGTFLAREIQQSTLDPTPAVQVAAVLFAVTGLLWFWWLCQSIVTLYLKRRYAVRVLGPSLRDRVLVILRNFPNRRFTEADLSSRICVNWNLADEAWVERNISRYMPMDVLCVEMIISRDKVQYQYNNSQTA